MVLGNKLLLCFLLIIMLFSFSKCSSSPPEFSEDDWYKKTHAPDAALLYANNVAADGTFFNPWMEREKRKGRYFRSKGQFEEPSVAKYGAVPNDFSYLSDNTFDSITNAGHASIIIKMNGQTIFTDPFFSNAAAIVQKKVKIKFDFSKVAKKPVVLISHNHYDHLDKYSVKQLAKKDAVFIVPLGLKKLVSSYGAKDVRELGWWQNITIDGIEYTFVPAQHWSRRLWQKGGSTLWGGYVIKGAKTIYFSGDTGYFIGFKEFGNRWDIDYAIMGAGAYEPRWFMHYAHMNVKEFLMAAQDIKAKISIPMHFGVITLSNEPLLYPLFEIDNAIKQNPELANSILPLRVGEYTKIQ